MPSAVDIARHLLSARAVKLSPGDPFTWASGLRSPIYCDNRVLLSYPTVRADIIDGFVAAAGEFGQLDGVAGVATAGIPHGTLLADRLGLPFIYIRSAAKGHGWQNQIEGRLQEGARYLVVEDLVSTGGSSLKAIEALRAAGGRVAGAVAIFTYGFPSAARAFAGADVPLQTLSDYPTLLQVATSDQAITPAQADALGNWREDPKAWSDRFSS